jgi:short-subunit dehydrogenase
VLIANAGIGGGRTIEDADAAGISRVVRLNLEVPAIMAAAALASMRERDSGHLVFISSLAGKAIPAGSALYASTKAGLRALAVGLAHDLHGSGVGVSVIYPGFIRDAGMFADSGAKPPPGIGTSTPAAVGTAVADAIERGREQVDVAPPQQRGFANLAFHLPGVSSRLERAIAGDSFSRDVAGRGKRKSGDGAR